MKAMSGFSLPATVTPDWARVIPEDVWKAELLARLRNHSKYHWNVLNPQPLLCASPYLYVLPILFVLSVNKCQPTLWCTCVGHSVNKCQSTLWCTCVGHSVNKCQSTLWCTCVGHSVNKCQPTSWCTCVGHSCTRKS